MTLKERFENHPVIFGASLFFAGVAATVFFYDRIAAPKGVSLPPAAVNDDLATKFAAEKERSERLSSALTSAQNEIAKLLAEERDPQKRLALKNLQAELFIENR
ncbi:hypothetical protein OH491_21755 [Termitidicoccus mucosus]